MNKVISQIEDLYETQLIVRAFILCDTEDTLNELAHGLDEKNHTVFCIRRRDLEEERPVFSHVFHAFKESARIVTMTLETWNALKDRVEVDVLPYQNLFVMINLEDEIVKYIARYVCDANSRGFYMPDVTSHLLVTQTNESGEEGGATDE